MFIYLFWCKINNNQQGLDTRGVYILAETNYIIKIVPILDKLLKKKNELCVLLKPKGILKQKRSFEFNTVK